MKAGVVGVGKLGGEIAFAPARDGTWDELVLYDVVEGLAVHHTTIDKFVTPRSR